jgi:hypothetical protein
MWVSMAQLTPGYSLRSPAQGLVPSRVDIKIRVKRPYAAYTVDSNTINDGYRYFTFNTNGFAPEVEANFGKKALDLVSVVPNPYYAYSKYEDPGNRLDNRIKITNLPEKCLVNIYTVDGVLVRAIRKDDPNRTYVEWDLKNDAKAPLASGVYLIHIKATDLGEERIVKWFGIMRPADYDSF